MVGAYGKKQSTISTLGWSLAIVLVYSFYLTVSSTWGRQGEEVPDIMDTLFLDFTRRGNYTLARAPAAVHLERRIDVDPMLGICYNQKPTLQGVPSHVCEDLQCLWLESLQLNIDVSRNPLRVLPGPSEFKASQCSLPQGGQLPLMSDERPFISFILTMHNHPQITAQCLLELFRTSHEAPSAEYVIIDDGSTEDTSPMTQTVWRLRELFNVQVKYRRNEQATGYGPANALGIHLATGKYIAMINNDMFVVKGWLTAILQTFEINPHAGVVGPMFLGDNDLITEAGGLVFSDAGAANYARGKEPYHEIYFLRKADYISAACVVMLKSTYKGIGGFDPQYIMGYYEDTDLAMTVRAAGLDVLFQPLAVNFHQEGGTFGTEGTSDLKRRLMAENKEKFLSKWSTILQDKHCPSDIDQVVAFNRAGFPKLLWVDDIVPEPDRDSGSIRNINLLRILLEAGYHVTFAPTAGGREQHYVTKLRLMGVHVFPVMAPEQWMLQYNGRCMFDLIMVARRLVFEAAQGQIAAHCPEVPIIYDTVDVHFLREARDAITTLMEKEGPSWDFKGITRQKVMEWLEQPSPEAEKVRHTRDSEMYFIGKSKVTIVVSPEEVDLIHHYEPEAKVAVVTNIHDLSNMAESHCEGRMGTLFVGNMNHIPNRQAIEGLVTEVLPLVLKLMPSHLLEAFRMNIVGSNVVPDYLLKLFAKNKGYVVFHGQLPDKELFELYGKVRVAVAPLLSGAGVKGKVNQAMKYGVAVVATPIAVEGMHGRDGVDCMIGKSPEEFARKIVQLHTDCDLWQRLVDGGRRNMMDHFSVEAARPLFLQALTDVGRGPLPERLRGTCSTKLEDLLSATEQV